MLSKTMLNSGTKIPEKTSEIAILPSYHLCDLLLETQHDQISTPEKGNYLNYALPVYSGSRHHAEHYLLDCCQKRWLELVLSLKLLGKKIVRYPGNICKIRKGKEFNNSSTPFFRQLPRFNFFKIARTQDIRSSGG